MSSKGVVGIFADPHEIKEGADALRKARFHHLDAYTPFPVHGIDKCLGLKRSWISAVTLLFGIFGCVGGLALTIWTSAIDWPIIVGGKAFASIPAFIPVVFECTILFAGVSTFFAALYFCGLPKPPKALVDPRVTNDAFALWAPVKDPQRIAEAQRLMKEHGAYEVTIV